MDYLIDINTKRVQEQVVYSVPFWVGAIRGTPIDLVLATDCEWTFITGTNCTWDDGCSHGIYDYHWSKNKNVNWN